MADRQLELISNPDASAAARAAHLFLEPLLEQLGDLPGEIDPTDASWQ